MGDGLNAIVGLVALVLVVASVIFISNMGNSSPESFGTGNVITAWSAGGGGGSICNSDVVTCSDGTVLKRDSTNGCKFPSCPVVGNVTGERTNSTSTNSTECVIDPNELVLERVACGSTFVDTLKQITVQTYNITDTCIPGNLTLERACVVNIKFPSDSNSSLGTVILNVTTKNVCAKKGQLVSQNFSFGEVEGILISSCDSPFWRIKF